MGSLTRAEKSERTFEAAATLAQQNGMRLSNPSDGCYQLRHKANGWILNLYPRRKGLSPRAYHDPQNKGPFLPLPENWSLLDVVKAAADKWNAVSAVEGLSKAACDYIDRTYGDCRVKIDGDHITIHHAHGFFSGCVSDIEGYAAADAEEGGPA